MTEINALDATCFRIRQALQNHRYEDAKGIIDGLADRAEPEHWFAAYERFEDLPLQFAPGADIRTIEALSRLEVVTIGDLRAVKTAELVQTGRSGITAHRIRKMRQQADRLIFNFHRWQRRRAEQCQ